MKKLIFVLFLFCMLILCVVVYTQNRSDELVKQDNSTQVTPNGGCFQYQHTRTLEAPYDVSEKIEISIDGDMVEGVKSGTQSGPDMTNGYEGTLVGTYNGNIIEVIFSYTIEGSSQKEKEIYKIGENVLTKTRYVLEEVDGILVPDLNSVPQYMDYTKVACS